MMQIEFENGNWHVFYYGPCANNGQIKTSFYTTSDIDKATDYLYSWL
jgi:hypothetical protein